MRTVEWNGMYLLYHNLDERRRGEVRRQTFQDNEDGRTAKTRRAPRKAPYSDSHGQRHGRNQFRRTYLFTIGHIRAGLALLCGTAMAFPGLTWRSWRLGGSSIFVILKCLAQPRALSSCAATDEMERFDRVAMIVAERGSDAVPFVEAKQAEDGVAECSQSVR